MGLCKGLYLSHSLFGHTIEARTPHVPMCEYYSCFVCMRCTDVTFLLLCTRRSMRNYEVTRAVGVHNSRADGTLFTYLLTYIPWD